MRGGLNFGYSSPEIEQRNIRQADPLGNDVALTVRTQFRLQIRFRDLVENHLWNSKGRQADKDNG